MSLAKIFAIVNQKGGVGKTTSSVNLATSFAKMGEKTLLIDLDPQGNSSTGVGIKQSQRQKTIYEAMAGECSIAQTIIPTQFYNLQIITSTVDLSACEIEMAEMKNREFFLRKLLDDIKKDYDYIFIDCPPSLGLLTINGLAASDSVLIPMQCEFYSLEGLSHLLTTLDLVKNNLNHDLQIAGIMLTMHDKRNKITSAVEVDVRNFLQDKVYKNVIPRNVKLSEAPSHGVPAVLYSPACQGSKAYDKLAKEILERQLKENEIEEVYERKEVG